MYLQLKFGKIQNIYLTQTLIIFSGSSVQNYTPLLKELELTYLFKEKTNKIIICCEIHNVQLCMSRILLYASHILPK